ncbi:MAG: hypothetical protein CMP67_08840 [Flavobacteriales bacterium]|nr:hypothetical protein [Flavobacteriales bacterium]|tara:strand:+ start:799 stop:1368 length:570 start_codon:yes stop_codon:yes gene_type:complete
MKKLVLTLFVGALMLAPSTSNAQAFEQGKSQVSAGYGFGNFIQALFETYAVYDGFDKSLTGPLFVRYEYGVSEKIGFGVNFAYASVAADYNDIFGDPQSINWSSWSALARVNRHFGESDKFDPYIGLGLGYRTASWKFTELGTGTTTSLFPLGMEATVGARYMFTPNIGLYSEIGIAKAIAQFGINAKF